MLKNLDIEKNTLVFVDNFEDFKFIGENRVIDKSNSKRMKSLKQALMDGKYMPPVLIDTEGYILDGQHRVTAALLLNKEGKHGTLPVIMIDPDDTHQTSIEIARILNSTQKKWTVNDYEKSFSTEGNSSYVACARLTSEAFKMYGIKLTISAKKVLLGISEKADLFYSGNINVSKENYDNALEILKEFFNCADGAAYPMNFSVTMAKAFVYIRKFEDYDADKMAKYLEDYEIEWPDAGSKESTFIEVFRTIIDSYKEEDDET